MSHVLLLDTEAGHLRRIADDLARAGMEVSEAACVASALETARQVSPDLILSVEKLDELDVLDLLELKRVDKKIADIPVVVVSGSAKRKLDCYRLGCDEFIELPVDEAEMIFRVCAVLRRAMKFGLSGDFEQVRFVDVVQMLVAARRDGRLRIEADKESGELIFQQGQVVYAEAGEFRGEDAFLLLLRATQQSGSFAFSAEEAEVKEPNIQKRTDQLLYSLANMLEQ